MVVGAVVVSVAGRGGGSVLWAVSCGGDFFGWVVGVFLYPMFGVGT